MHGCLGYPDVLHASDKDNRIGWFDNQQGGCIGGFGLKCALIMGAQMRRSVHSMYSTIPVWHLHLYPHKQPSLFFALTCFRTATGAASVIAADLVGQKYGRCTALMTCRSCAPVEQRRLARCYLWHARQQCCRLLSQPANESGFLWSVLHHHHERGYRLQHRRR